jgi:hypothetical protein
MERQAEPLDRSPADENVSRLVDFQPDTDNHFLLLLVSIIAMVCSVIRITFGLEGSGLPLILAAIWIPFFALTVGKTWEPPRAKPATPNRPIPRGKTEPPFQFGLSDLLCAVFVVAFLMGIISMMRETDLRDESYLDLWNFLSGSVLTVAATLLISSWRTRSKAGWIVGIPIFLGTLAHLLFGLAVDDFVLLAWSFIGLWCGFAGLRLANRRSGDFLQLGCVGNDALSHVEDETDQTHQQGQPGNPAEDPL